MLAHGPSHIGIARWYEIRVDGSIGTSAGVERGATDGIAMGDGGRLCSVASGQALRFKSEQEATDYLMQTTVRRNLPFIVVACEGAKQT